MKKTLLFVIAFALFPSVAFATPFVKDSFNATDSAATSTFAGNFSVAGQVQFGSNAFLNSSLLNAERTFIFPDVSGTVALLEANQSWSGFQFFNDGIQVSGNLTIMGNKINNTIGPYDINQFFVDAGNNAFVIDTNLFTDNRVFTFPDLSGTVGLLEASQTWSGENAFSQGASATTTINFGKMGDTSSKACFNTKNTDGADISFYFVGTSMVVETTPCQ